MKIPLAHQLIAAIGSEETSARPQHKALHEIRLGWVRNGVRDPINEGVVINDLDRHIASFEGLPHHPVESIEVTGKVAEEIAHERAQLAIAVLNYKVPVIRHLHDGKYAYT